MPNLKLQTQEVHRPAPSMPQGGGSSMSALQIAMLEDKIKEYVI